MTTPHTPSFRLPAEDNGSITLSHIALSDMLTQSFHHGRIDGVRTTCDLMDETVFEMPGDALATIAMALVHSGIDEVEVSQWP